MLKHSGSDELRNTKTMNNPNLHQPSSHLTIYQKEPYYNGIEVYNNLPEEIIFFSTYKTSFIIFIHVHSIFLLYVHD
jgi:hypothetical protein